jgi:disulfide bond formation protein DsbB
MKHIALAGAALAALALGTALGSERFLHLIPCALCYLERWPYRFAIALGLLGFFLPRRPAAAACVLMLMAYVAAAGTAFLHVGVEQHWWKSPYPECTALDLRGLSPAERLVRMPLTPSKSCEDPDYLIPAIPIDMPEANFAYALVVGAGLATWMARSRKAP